MRMVADDSGVYVTDGRSMYCLSPELQTRWQRQVNFPNSPPSLLALEPMRSALWLHQERVLRSFKHVQHSTPGPELRYNIQNRDFQNAEIADMIVSTQYIILLFVERCRI